LEKLKRMDLDSLDEAVAGELSGALAALATLVAIPSVAAQAADGAPMEPCARRVAELLREHGLEARVTPTDGGPPVVFAEDRRAGVDAPTVLFYNHYDVQPADPFDLWESDPWTLRVDGDYAFARGVSDDKGHIVCRLMALDALRSAYGGTLPVNIKWVVEGEEEVSSIHLPAWVEANAALLDADVCIWEFGGVDEGGHPEIVCGLRGIACFELHARTIAYDAHSGVGGSLLPNAAWRLVQALNTLKDDNDRILIPGHYDAVRAATDEDLALLRALPNSARTEAYLKREFGVTEFLGGATGVEYERRQVFEPTCTINGLQSGYQGEGSKTVLPAHAMAKLDFRLVPDQDPDVLRAALRAHLDTGGFTDVEVVYLGGQRAARFDPNHPMVQLALSTARDVFGTEPSLYPLVGVSGPMYPFVVRLGQPVVTIGCGYPGARVHSPNENLRLTDLVRGAQHTARFLAAL
jgi:acetylornithine deacetylase/succinyl-diaminopimelate desuccinylase-like protein